MTEHSDLLSQAVAHHAAGRLEAAEHLYRALLALDADHPEVNHGFGALLMELDRFEQGIGHLKRALERAPETARYWVGLTEGFLIAGQPDNASAVLDRAIKMGLDNTISAELGQRIQDLASRDDGAAQAPPEVPDSPAPPLKATPGITGHEHMPSPQSRLPIKKAGASSASRGRRKRSSLDRHRVTDATKGSHRSRKESWVEHFNRHQFDVAESMARQLTQDFPDDPFGWKALGVVLVRTQRHKDALPILEAARDLSPDDVETLDYLGNAFRALDRLEEALSTWTQATQIQPGYVSAQNNRGNVLQALGRSEESIQCYREALSINPRHVEALMNLGSALQGMGQFEDSLSCFRALLDIHHETPLLEEIEIQTKRKMGAILYELGQTNEAAAYFREVRERRPNDAHVHNNLGNVLQDLGQIQAALEHHQHAIEIDPTFANAYNSMGTAYKSMGLMERALECFERAIELDPEFSDAFNNAGIALQELGRFDEAEIRYRFALALKSGFAKAYDNLLFTLNYHPDKSAGEIYRSYQDFDRELGRSARAHWRDHVNDPDPGRRLRIGYVSPDFRNHSIRHFLEPLLAHHDRQRFDLVAYAQLRKEDGLTTRYRGYFDHWRPTSGISDEELAERIRIDRVDILVDLGGHTGGNRLGVFTLKPAPVAVSWLGYGYTTGLSAVDYFLADPFFVPPEHDAFFAEKPWRIEPPAFVYRPAEGMGEVSPLPALTNGYLNLGTLSRSVRINHRVISVWSEILRRLPNARLTIDSLNYSDPTARDTLTARFASQGIEPARLHLGYHSPPWDLMRAIDIGLDCFPHNSGTTLFEHLYMGMPFVTLAGRPGVGRIGAGILHGLGHPEWVAESEEQYVEIVVALARDLPALAALRQGLREEMHGSALMDERGFARKVERAYRTMWQQWCETTGVS